MDLNGISVFVRVVEAGSFTVAARQLEMPKSTVSLKVSQLEQALGVTLLKRTTRSLSLTEEGRRYHEVCTRSLVELEKAKEALNSAQREPRGLLRVTAVAGSGMGVIGDVVAGFLREHPQIEVELVLTSRVVDIIAENFDVAVRAGVLRDSRLRARLVGTSSFGLYASPLYLQKNPAPKNISELQAQGCIRVSFPTESATSYDLRQGKNRVKIPSSGRFSSNEMGAVRKMTLQGIGIGYLPENLTGEDVKEGRLVPILPEWASAKIPVHLVYPAQRFSSAKVQAFVAYAAQVFSAKWG